MKNKVSVTKLTKHEIRLFGIVLSWYWTANLTVINEDGLTILKREIVITKNGLVKEPGLETFQKKVSYFGHMQNWNKRSTRQQVRNQLKRHFC